MDKYQFEYCAFLIWGVIPVDKKWAEETSIFKSKSIELLKEYDIEKEKLWNIKMKELSKVSLIDILKESIQLNNTLIYWNNWLESKKK